MPRRPTPKLSTAVWMGYPNALVSMPGVQGGSLDHVLFITQTVAIDYQRDADGLWESSRKSFANAETRYVFDPAAVHANRRGFARTCRNTAFPKNRGRTAIFGGPSRSPSTRMEGDPSNFLADYGWGSKPSVVAGDPSEFARV